MTFQEAKRLSLMKWEYIYDNDGSMCGLLGAYPELKELENYCGFCEKYLKVNASPISKERYKERHKCGKCPIVIKEGVDCFNAEHPFIIWGWNGNKKNALAVLELVRKAREVTYYD